MILRKLRDFLDEKYPIKIPLFFLIEKILARTRVINIFINLYIINLYRRAPRHDWDGLAKG